MCVKDAYLGDSVLCCATAIYRSRESGVQDYKGYSVQYSSHVN